MGVVASSEANGTLPGLGEKVWQDGSFFKLLQDEGFVKDKCSELKANQDVNMSMKLETEKARLGEMTASEIREADDLLYIKLFGDSSTIDIHESRVRGLLKGTVLARDPKEIMTTKKQKKVQEAILQDYLDKLRGQLATARSSGMSEVNSADDAMEKAVSGEMEDASVQKFFNVGFIRMQLEMLRGLYALSPQVYEQGVMALVQTAIDFPDFQLAEVNQQSIEPLIIDYVESFCNDMIENGNLEHRSHAVTMLLLLAFAVSSGRVSMLLVAANKLRSWKQESHISYSGRSFIDWIDLFVSRLEKYRLSFPLGPTADGTNPNGKFPILQMQEDMDKQVNSDFSVEFHWAITTDGTYLYKWHPVHKLQKIGTGENATVRGRVYHQVESECILESIRRKKRFHYAMYGSCTDVLDKVRLIIRKGNDAKASVQSLLELSDENDFAETSHEEALALKLIIFYWQDNKLTRTILTAADEFHSPHTDINDSEVDSSSRVKAAYYGHFELLDECAVDKWANAFAVEQNPDGIKVSSDVINDLLVASNAETTFSSEDGFALNVIYSVDDLPWVDRDVCEVEEWKSDVVKQVASDIVSSIAYCEDCLYISLNTYERMGRERFTSTQRILCIDPESLAVKQKLSFTEMSVQVDSKTPVKDGKVIRKITSEGNFLYNLCMGSAYIQMNVYLPTISQDKKCMLTCIRRVQLNIDLTTFSSMASWHAELESTKAFATLNVPAVYTNGSNLAVLIPAIHDDAEGENTHAKFQVQMYSCLDGRRVSSVQNITQEVKPKDEACVFQCNLPSAAVCFDAENNRVWVLNGRKNNVSYYENGGKHVALGVQATAIELDYFYQEENADIDKSSRFSHAASKLLRLPYRNAAVHALSSELDVVCRVKSTDMGKVAEVPYVCTLYSSCFDHLASMISESVQRAYSGSSSSADVDWLCLLVGICRVTAELLARNDLSVSKETSKKFISKLDESYQMLLKLNLHVEHGAEDSQMKHALLLAERHALRRAMTQLTTSDVEGQMRKLIQLVESCGADTSTDKFAEIALLCQDISLQTSVVSSKMVEKMEVEGLYAKLVECTSALEEKYLVECDEKYASTLSTLLSLLCSVTQVVFILPPDISPLNYFRSLDTLTRVMTMLRKACHRVCSTAVQIAENKSMKPLKLLRLLEQGWLGRLLPMVLALISVLLAEKNLRAVESSVGNLFEIYNSFTSSKSTDERALLPPLKKKAFYNNLCAFFVESTNSMMSELQTLRSLADFVPVSEREQQIKCVKNVVVSKSKESEHDYDNNLELCEKFEMPGVESMTITFDPRSCTEHEYDFLTFYKDADKTKVYGESKYTGRAENFPGVGGKPPLVINSDHCYVYFCSDTTNTEWGYKFTARSEVSELQEITRLHWTTHLIRDYEHLMQEACSLLVDGTFFSPVVEAEVSYGKLLRSELFQYGKAIDVKDDNEEHKFLQEMISPAKDSSIRAFLKALKRGLGPRASLLISRSLSSVSTAATSSKAQVTTAVRAVAAAILHHNLWSSEAMTYASDVDGKLPEHISYAWKNAQKMRDWFYLGDAKDMSSGRQSRQHSATQQHQPSAFGGMTEKALDVLCSNVIRRAQFLLQLKPALSVDESDAKRRWGLVARKARQLGREASNSSTMDSWFNLVDEMQGAIELRETFKYRKGYSERQKQGMTKTVTEQILEFVQSDVDVDGLETALEARNHRVESRAAGVTQFTKMLLHFNDRKLQCRTIQSLRKAMELSQVAYGGSCTESLNSLAMKDSNSSLARIHFDIGVSGCTVSAMNKLRTAFAAYMEFVSTALSEVSAKDEANASFVLSLLQSAVLDYYPEDVHLLKSFHDHVVRLLSDSPDRVRKAAQEVIDVLIKKFLVHKNVTSLENENTEDIKSFQTALVTTVARELSDVSTCVSRLPTIIDDKRLVTLLEPFYLPANEPGIIAPANAETSLIWNHSVMLWVYAPKLSQPRGLQVGDTVVCGVDWKEEADNDILLGRKGTVENILGTSTVRVQWKDNQETGCYEFNPAEGVYEVCAVDDTVGGSILFQGYGKSATCSALQTPWSHVKISLTNQLHLHYEVCAGGNRKFAFTSNYALNADVWVHIALVQDERALKMVFDGTEVESFELDCFLQVAGDEDITKSQVIESDHPETTDEFSQHTLVRIPGASKLRIMFHPTCCFRGEEDGVTLYKSARCEDHWGESLYKGNEEATLNAESEVRVLRHTDVTIVEVPTDHLVLYTHYSSINQAVGHRLLVKPVFESMPKELKRARINNSPIYFGEPPEHACNERSASVWVHRPTLAPAALQEDAISKAIEESRPCIDRPIFELRKDRILNLLSMYRTVCTSSVIPQLASVENLKNLLVLCFSGAIAIDTRCAGIIVLSELGRYISPADADAAVTEVFPDTRNSFVEEVFSRIAALGSAHEHAHDAHVVVPVQAQDIPGKDTGTLFRVQASWQGLLNLSNAYVLLIRKLSSTPAWSEAIYKYIAEVLGGLSTMSSMPSAQKLERVQRARAASILLSKKEIRKLAVGERVTAIIEESKEVWSEIGTVLSIRIENGERFYRVSVDGSQSQVLEMQASRIYHYNGEEEKKVAAFLQNLMPFVKDLCHNIRDVLQLDATFQTDRKPGPPCLIPTDGIQTARTCKPYTNGQMRKNLIFDADVAEVWIYFDSKCKTSGAADYVQFSRIKDSDPVASAYPMKWEEEKYFGDIYPGCNGNPPLRIPCNSINMLFNAETANEDECLGIWIVAVPMKRVYQPQAAPPTYLSALAEVQAQCLTTLATLVNTQKDLSVFKSVTSLLPTLTQSIQNVYNGQVVCPRHRHFELESPHPYTAECVGHRVICPHATRLCLTFDDSCRTDSKETFISIVKLDSSNDRWGKRKYFGSDQDWPGMKGRPPLIIPGGTCAIIWRAEESSSSSYGFKVHIQVEYSHTYAVERSRKRLELEANVISCLLNEQFAPQLIANNNNVSLDNGYTVCETRISHSDLIKYSDPRDEIKPAVSSCYMEESRCTYCVISASGAPFYKEPKMLDIEGGRLQVGEQINAISHSSGWLEFITTDSETGNRLTMWTKQRHRDTVLLAPLNYLMTEEFLVAPNIIGELEEGRNSTFEMTNRQRVQLSVDPCSWNFIREDLQVQSSRLESLLYDIHRAQVTHAARKLFEVFISKMPVSLPVHLDSLGSSRDLFGTLLQIYTPSRARKMQHGFKSALDVLQEYIRCEAGSGLADEKLVELIVRAVQTLQRGRKHLPEKRVAYYEYCTSHPCSDTSLSKSLIPFKSAKAIQIVFDEQSVPNRPSDLECVFEPVSGYSETTGEEEYSEAIRIDGSHPAMNNSLPLTLQTNKFALQVKPNESEAPWGVRFHAMASFHDLPMEDDNTTSLDKKMRLLEMCLWLLSSTGAATFKGDESAVAKEVFSGSTIAALAAIIETAPKRLGRQALDVITALSHHHEWLARVPPTLIERIRLCVTVQFGALAFNEGGKLKKSQYLQSLAHCYIGLVLATDSCMYAIQRNILPSMVVSDAACASTDKLWTSNAIDKTRAFACELVLKELGPSCEVGLLVKSNENEEWIVRWKCSGEVQYAGTEKVVSSPSLKMCQGDILMITIDFQNEVLTLRRNRHDIFHVCGIQDNDTAISWANLVDLIARGPVQVAAQSSRTQVTYQEIPYASTNLLPELPNVNRKIVDAVAMLLDFDTQLGSNIVSRESHHPVQIKEDVVKEIYVHIPNAVALEVRFDEQTELDKYIRLRFSDGVAGDRNTSKETVVENVSGSTDSKRSPQRYHLTSSSSSPVSINIGDEVVRSLDWIYGNEDGGPGQVGVVKELVSWKGEDEKGVLVQWKTGENEGVYRYDYLNSCDVMRRSLSMAQREPLIIFGNTLTYSVDIDDTFAEKDNASTLWGYKFHVIPHFALESIGRQLFSSKMLQFNEQVRALDASLHSELVRYVNKMAHTKEMTDDELLSTSWRKLAPSASDLTRWPTLVRVVTDPSTRASTAEPLTADQLQTTSHDETRNGDEFLEEWFKMLQYFNNAIRELLPYIRMSSPLVTKSTLKYDLERLVKKHKYCIFNAVKKALWEDALTDTVSDIGFIKLQFNRSKAAHHRLTGKPDLSGWKTLFSQAFRAMDAELPHFHRNKNRIYKAQFIGENAIDAGGPFRETLEQFCEELQSKQLELMLCTPNALHNVGTGRDKWLLHPNATTWLLGLQMEFLGKLMACMMRSEDQLSLDIAPIIWKRLVGDSVSLTDLAGVDSMMVNSMHSLRSIDQYGVTEDTFEDVVMETFTTLSTDNRVIELKPGGHDIAVTFDTRCEYVDLVEGYRLAEYDTQVHTLLNGFAQVVPVKLMSLFTGEELEQEICGMPEVDIALLKKCTEYSGCNETDPHIVLFWQVMDELSQDEKSAFLRFAWGRSRLPTIEADFPQKFKLQSFGKSSQTNVDMYLPVSHTCFFSMELPRYSSFEIMKEKLLYAIYNCRSIDGDGDMIAANQAGWEE